MSKRKRTNRTRLGRDARRDRRRAARKDAKMQRRQHGIEPRTSRRQMTRWDILGILALGLLVIVSYFPAFRAGFVWDDIVGTSMSK